jgi:spermidine synthase
MLNPQFLMISAIVFVANMAILILQLLASKILSPFVGSALETWTANIGVVLVAIALGNWWSSSLNLSRRYLPILLLLGALSTLWMIAFPMLIEKFSLSYYLPLLPRILVMFFLLVFPVVFVLSLLTPLAIRLASEISSQSDYRSQSIIVARTAGVMFASSTLGCLLGNYLTGFWLIPSYNIDTIVIVVAAALFIFAVLSILFVFSGQSQAAEVTPKNNSSQSTKLPLAMVMVPFACSFAGMTLELAGVRVMAQIVGVSLYTWTGVIGVMLAGTAIGNYLGGFLAASKKQPTILIGSLIFASFTIMLSIGIFFFYNQLSNFTFNESNKFWIKLFFPESLMLKVLLWSFLLYFLPMFSLGTISPQVIRILSDKNSSSAIAGRVYAISTLGAIVGTFATGLFLLQSFGALRTICFVCFFPIVSGLIALKFWNRVVLFYMSMIIAGLAFGGMLYFRAEQKMTDSKNSTTILRESNYFTIKVSTIYDPENSPVETRLGVKSLVLDRLIHSMVDPNNPTYLYYKHENIQMEFLRGYASYVPEPQVLVIGGGGYTYPRAARAIAPQSTIDVVEIDPLVTKTCYDLLDLKPDDRIRSFNMDGRQYVAEYSKKNHYQLVSLDAVNDLSVPYHLITKEFNDQIKSVMTADGVFLVSIIDRPSIGRVSISAMETMKKTFKHVEILSPLEDWDADLQVVFIIVASNEPVRKEMINAELEKKIRDPRIALLGGTSTKYLWKYSFTPPEQEIKMWINKLKPVILTDQYSPIDWLMAEVFRKRNE